MILYLKEELNPKSNQVFKKINILDKYQCNKFARFQTALIESKNQRACLSSGTETLSDFCLADTNVILQVNKQFKFPLSPFQTTLFSERII